MLRRGEKPEKTNEHVTDVLQSAQRRFGKLLREVCEIVGLTQGKLSRKAAEELKRMVEIGDIHPDDHIGSLKQPVLSKVMAGIQEPTYYQVYIWLAVLRNWYEDPTLALLCKKLHVPLPKFSSELERDLWRLASYVPPSELHQVYEEKNEIQLLEGGPITSEIKRGTKS